MTGVQKEEEAIEPSIGYERVQSLNNVKITLKQGSVKMITPIMITESISKDVEVGIKGKSERVVNGGDMKNMLDLSPQKDEYKGSQVCRRVDEIEGRILQKD